MRLPALRRGLYQIRLVFFEKPRVRYVGTNIRMSQLSKFRRACHSSSSDCQSLLVRDCLPLVQTSLCFHFPSWAHLFPHQSLFCPGSPPNWPLLRIRVQVQSQSFCVFSLQLFEVQTFCFLVSQTQFFYDPPSYLSSQFQFYESKSTHRMSDLRGSFSVRCSVKRSIGNACEHLVLLCTECSRQSVFCSSKESGCIDHPGFKKEKISTFLAECGLEDFPLITVMPCSLCLFLVCNY